MQGFKKDELPYWLQQNFVLRGQEGGDDAGDEGDDDSDDDTDDGDDDKSGDDKSGDDKKDKEDPVAALKETLRKERAARKKAEREKKALERKQSEASDKDKPEVERLTSEREQAVARADKLAGAFRKTAIDRAIEREAQRLGFADVDDALSLVRRDDIEVDQDEEEPAEVEVDTESVKRAVKALADRKKHLLKSDGGSDGDGQRTGSKGGGRCRSGEPSEEQKLRMSYRNL